MPDIAFAPRPMVDPYGGKTGEIVGELFSTIGQIHLLRQQRNQSNAILDIMKSDWSPEEKQAGILRVAQNGGDVFRNMMARQGLADALVPESERRLQQARLESTQALTKWRSEGGARGAKAGGGIDEIAKWQKSITASQEAKRKAQIESKVNATPLDPELIDYYDGQIKFGRKKLGELTGGGKPTRPPVPDIYGVVLKSFRSAKDISSADKQARKELVAKGLAKDDDQAASMILDAVGKMPSLNKIMPTGADTGQRPGAFVQAATAPQLAPTQIPSISTDEEYDKLPSGTEFIDAETGKRYRKP